jgi:flagella basal body P-ring formation protein FlgA
MRVRAALVALLLFPALADARAAVLRVAPDVSVSGDEITLGDLAASDGDEELRRLLSSVRLGPAPVPGGTLRLDAEYIRVRARGVLDPARAQLLLPDRVTVARTYQVVTGAEIAEAAQARLMDRLEAREPRGESYALIPASRPADLRVPTGRLEILPRVGEVSPTQGFLSIAVVIRVDGRDHQTVPMTFRVGRRVQVVVANHALEPRTVLGPADFRIETRVSTEIPNGARAAMSDPAGMEVLRSVRAGEIVTDGVVRAKILVRRGELVTLLLEGHGFKITTQGRAGEDARRGDLVRVLNSTSKREVVGRVEGPGVVRVPQQ